MTFPVQHSLLTPDALAEEVSARYRLPSITRCEFLRAGLNDHYLVVCGDARFVLRAYRHNWRSQSDIDFELELLEHLEEKGAPVASPVRGLDGQLSWRLTAPEGERHLALFDYAPGSPTRREDITIERCRAYGEGMALIHNAMDSFVCSHQRFQLDQKHLLDEPLQVLESRLSHRREDWDYLLRVTYHLKTVGDELDGQGLEHGICHGDFHGGNANYDAVHGFTFFDFDCGGVGWRAYDLAVFRWGLSVGPVAEQAIELWTALLQGYRSQRTLAEVDESAVDAFVAVRQIWFLGLHAANGFDWGYGYQDDAFYDRHLKILRDWIAEKLPSLVENV